MIVIKFMDDNFNVPFICAMFEDMLEDDSYQVHHCKEDLMFIIKQHNLAPSVFNEVMQWAKSSSKSGYNFEGPRYETVLKYMCRWFSVVVGGVPIQHMCNMGGHQGQDNHVRFA